MTDSSPHDQIPTVLSSIQHLLSYNDHGASASYGEECDWFSEQINGVSC
jgi:hypothetical protein